jgi:hypothetical protein
MNYLKSATALVGSLCIIACAKHPHEIQAQYVSPLQYQSYSCKQLEQEMQVLTRRVQEVGGVVKNEASSDDAEMAVGLILLWPTLFFLDGDTPQAAEYARLKGEFEALEKAAIQKNCGFHIEYPKIDTVPPKTDEPAYPSDRRRR